MKRICIYFTLFFFLFSFSFYSVGEEHSSAWAHFLSGELYKWQGKEEKSLKEFQNACNEDTSSSYLKEELAYSLLREGREKEARTLLEKLFKEGRGDKNVYLVLSLLYSKKGKERKSLLILRRAYYKFPHEPEVLLRLIEKYLKLGMRKKALILGNKLISFSPLPYKTSLGILYISSGLGKDGVNILNNVLKENPNSYRALLSLATYYEIGENFNKAIKFYKKCLEISPSYYLYHHIALINIRKGELGKALSIYKIILLSHPGDNLALQEVAYIYFQKGEYKKARDFLLKVKNPSFYTYYLLSSIELEEGNLKNAKKWLKKSEKINKYSPEFYSLLAAIKEKEGKIEEAEKILFNAIKKFSPSGKSHIYMTLGLLYMNEGKFKKAIHSFSRAKELSPDWDAPCFHLGAVYEREGSWIRAVYNLREAIRLNPLNSDALNYLGYMFADKGTRIKEAQELIKRALKIEPENAYYIDSLGWVYYREGKIKDALREIKKSLKILEKKGKDDAEIREHLGEIYLKLGRNKEAIESFERSIKLDPKNKKAVKKLEEVRKK